MENAYQHGMFNKKRFSGISTSNYLENKIIMHNSEKRKKNNLSSNANIVEFQNSVNKELVT